MKAVIFGITGQDGFYLSKLLQQQNIEVIGVSRENTQYITGDIADFSFVENIVKTELPDYIFHLAAHSVTAHDALFDNYHSISTGTLNILEAVYRHRKSCRVFISGSAIQFQNNGKPIDENTPFAVDNAYSLTRVQSVLSARYYRELGIKTYVGYFFNHDSPLRNEHHINKKITNFINEIRNGAQKTMEIGNWDVKKEFNFAGDMMQAIWLLINQDTHFEAVIGSGESYSIKEWIETCGKIADIKDIFSYFTQNNNYKAPYQILVSNPDLLRSLGWKPENDFYDLAEMMMNYA